jgi:hypothetical protein
MIQANRDLKTELLKRIEALDRQQALLPFSETSIDETIQQLEKINPIPRPLLSHNLSKLMGEWLLVYASNGTVVTRSIAEITNLFSSSILVKKIWQVLAIEHQKIAADNQVLIEFPLLGEYQLKAEGVWQPELDEQTAKVTFKAFSGQATKFFGRPSWSLPELKLPVLEFFRNEALWITSYLDEDIRIGRGVTGNLFVFQRDNFD